MNQGLSQHVYPPRRYFDAGEDTVFMSARGASVAGVVGRWAARIGTSQSLANELSSRR